MKTTPEERAIRNSHIVRLGKEKVRPFEIVRRVPGATHAIVSNVLFKARIAGEVTIGVRGRYRMRKDGEKCTLCIPHDISEMLKPAAIARGMSILELSKDILIAVADGGIVDAVLDDGVKSA